MALRPPPTQQSIGQTSGLLTQVWHLWFQDLFKNQTSHSELLNLDADDHLQYHTDERALTWLGTRSTDDLSEGVINLYDQGGLVATINRQASSVTLDNTAFQWNFDTSGGNLTATLPVGVDNRQYKIVNVGSKTLTIEPNGLELLLGENDSFMLYPSESLIIAYNSIDGWQ